MKTISVTDVANLRCPLRATRIYIFSNSRFATSNLWSRLWTCDRDLKLAIRDFELAIRDFELAIATSTRDSRQQPCSAVSKHRGLLLEHGARCLCLFAASMELFIFLCGDSSFIHSRDSGKSCSKGWPHQKVFSFGVQLRWDTNILDFDSRNTVEPSSTKKSTKVSRII